MSVGETNKASGNYASSTERNERKRKKRSKTPTCYPFVTHERV
jgi:hypothetical protein